MTNTEKRTKREKYVDLINLLKTMNETEEYVELCETEVEAIDKKAAKAKERAAAKKLEVDELFEKVEATLDGCEEAVSINDIVLAIGEDATAAKVVNRLKKMVDAGLVEKSNATIDKRRITLYKKIAG